MCSMGRDYPINYEKIKEEKIKNNKIQEKIIITKTEKTNLIEIADNKNNHTYLTLTTKDIVNLYATTIHLREGETKQFEKD